MIKPLKYQQGGTATSQEQLVQLFQTAAENAQVDPEQLVQKASEIAKDEEAAAQFMQGLQLCAQGDPEGIKFIKSLFQSPAFKKGGKIFEFICKHKKGGYVSGCGCKEEGGEIETREKLKPIGTPMQYEGTVYTDRYPASGEQITMGDTGNPMHIAAYNSYNHFGEGISVPTPQYRAMARGLIDGSGWGYNGRVLTPSEVNRWLNFNRMVEDSNKVIYEEPEQKLAEMQNGGMMQRSLPFTVSSLGMENENPAEFEKKTIMMRQRPMYAKSGSSGVGESEKSKEKKSDLKYNGTVSHDSDDYMSVETVGPLHRVIRAAYNNPSQLDTIIYSKSDRGYTSPHSNNEYWMDDAGIQKVDPMRWKRLNQGFDNAKNAELDALMDQAGFEQVREEPKKGWWLRSGGEIGTEGFPSISKQRPPYDRTSYFFDNRPLIYGNISNEFIGSPTEMYHQPIYDPQTGKLLDYLYYSRPEDNYDSPTSYKTIQGIYNSSGRIGSRYSNGKNGNKTLPDQNVINGQIVPWHQTGGSIDASRFISNLIKTINK